jgi:hypothetical protein
MIIVTRLYHLRVALGPYTPIAQEGCPHLPFCQWWVWMLNLNYHVVLLTFTIIAYLPYYRYGITVGSTYGIAPPGITEESKDIIRRHLNAYSDWALFGKVLFYFLYKCGYR